MIKKASPKAARALLCNAGNVMTSLPGYAIALGVQHVLFLV